MTKRHDIQGVRGLAIAAVLAFHLNEAAFPAGFVGVDMFFVLSGYLMAVILSKETLLNMTVFRTFYTHRFKRIVPLYAILIATLTVLVPCLLLQRDVVKFCKDVIWSAAFATNIQAIVEEKDYFSELFDSNVLTHTWSLGVEIQYYLIVPFIVLAQRKISTSFTSFTFQLLSSPNSAFNFLPSRVWQFLAGGLAHDLSPVTSGLSSGSSIKYEKLSTDESQDAEKQPEENINNGSGLFIGTLCNRSADFMSLVLCALVMSPWMVLPAPSLRFVAVVITGALLVLGCDMSRQGMLLTNPFLVYLGDISYVVYLAHWPIIILWKSVSDSTSLSITGIICCLLITFVISILTHHTIEQYFIRAKGRTAAIVVASLYGFLAIALVLNLPERMNTSFLALGDSGSSLDVASAIEWNEIASHNDYRKHRPFKECVDDPEGTKMRGGYTGKGDRFECIWKPDNSTGKLEILVVGNSVSQIATNILKSIIEQHFPEVALLRLYSMPACRPIEIVQYVCPPYHKALPKQVQAMRPDVTFVIYDDTTKRLTAPISNAATDGATREFIAFMQPIVNASRFVVLDEFYPKSATAAGMAISLQKRLMRNQDTTDLKGTLEAYNTKYANYFARLDRLPFPNLIRHNTSGAMCAEEKGVCWWYNRRNLHSYYTDNIHLTTDGLELLRASYTKILRTIIEQIV